MKLKKRNNIRKYMDIESQSIKNLLNEKNRKLCNAIAPLSENHLSSLAIDRSLSSNSLTGFGLEIKLFLIQKKKFLVKNLLFSTPFPILPMKFPNRFFKLIKTISAGMLFLKVYFIFNFKNIFAQYSKKTNLFLRLDIKPNFSACKML